jgi:hypothetical protein
MTNLRHMKGKRNRPSGQPREKYATRGLSVRRADAELVEWAEEKADSNRLSFSAYVMLLIEADKLHDVIGRDRALRLRERLATKAV